MAGYAPAALYLKLEVENMKKGKDLTGKRFGRLVVIERAENKGKYVMWKCLCNCGNYTVSRTGTLMSGEKLSCGCLHKEMTGKLNKPKRNEYEILGDEVRVSLRNSDEKMICDIEDWNKLKDYTWLLAKNGYAVTHKGKNVNMLSYFHAEVLQRTLGSVIDHINKNKLDNRKCNLRVTTQQVNSINSTTRKDNTSGVKGVRKRKDTGKWSASITYNHRTIYLGCYDTLKDAVSARKAAEEKYFEPLLKKR